MILCVFSNVSTFAKKWVIRHHTRTCNFSGHNYLGFMFFVNDSMNMNYYDYKHFYKHQHVLCLCKVLPFYVKPKMHRHTICFLQWTAKQMKLFALCRRKCILSMKSEHGLSLIRMHKPYFLINVIILWNLIFCFSSGPLNNLQIHLQFIGYALVLPYRTEQNGYNPIGSGFFITRHQTYFYFHYVALSARELPLQRISIESYYS